MSVWCNTCGGSGRVASVRSAGSIVVGVLASLTDEQLAEMGGERLPDATIRDKRGRYRNGSYLVFPERLHKGTGE